MVARIGARFEAPGGCHLRASDCTVTVARSARLGKDCNTAMHAEDKQTPANQARGDGKHPEVSDDIEGHQVTITIATGLVWME